MVFLVAIHKAFCNVIGEVKKGKFKGEDSAGKKLWGVTVCCGVQVPKTAQCWGNGPEKKKDRGVVGYDIGRVNLGDSACPPLWEEKWPVHRQVKTGSKKNCSCVEGKKLP